MEKDKEKQLNDSIKFINAFTCNINIDDIRLLSIVMDIYIENAMEDKIKSKLKNPEKILDGRSNFNYKCKLLDAFGVFDEGKGKKLRINIKNIHRIRNEYGVNPSEWTMS